MDKTCSMHGREVDIKFWLKNLKGRDNMETEE
jgi:hypothetical protein